MSYLIFWLALVAGIVFLLPLSEIIKGVRLKRAKVKGPDANKADHLSEPSRRILRIFNEIPAEHRPGYDIVAILSALDEKHDGAEAINKDFFRHRPGRPYPHIPLRLEFSWNHPETSSAAQKDYNDLRVSINKLRARVKEQEKALKLAGLSHHLDSVKDLVRELRREAKLVDEVTQSLNRMD